MIVLSGAKGVVGRPLAIKLQADRAKFLEVSRQASAAANHIQWDLTQEPNENVIEKLKGAKTHIHCAPIWLLPSHLETLADAGIERLIAFSSTSVLSKLKSSNPTEQNLVLQLSQSEQLIQEFCTKRKIALTIIRPSMIYGYGRDQNVSHIASFIQRYGFFVLVGKANGLRQPVHADDLVNACLNIIDNERTFGKTYNLAGAQAISYRTMVEQIFDGLGRPKRIISLPLIIFRPALMVAAKLTRFSYTPEMANRMMQDLNYDISEAGDDFSYQPSAFLEHPERDLA